MNYAKYIIFFIFCVINQPWIICGRSLKSHIKDHFSSPKPCTLHSGQMGVCKKKSKCSAVKDMTARMEKIVICGFKWFKPVVCCPIEGTMAVMKTPKVVEKNVPTGPSISFACGLSPTWSTSSNRHRRHVVGGEESSVGKYPWMAVIGSRVNSDIMWQCDGVLIHPEWVLSAVHCFLENSTYVVRLGEHDVSSTSDGASPQDFSASEIIFHPEFKSDIGYHDLALLKLEKRVQVTSSIMPICFPSDDDINLIGKTATLAGWGAEEFGGSLSNVLRDAEVMIFNTSVCDKSYSTLPDYDTIWPQGITDKNIICAGNVNGGIDACQGDSGGPLMLEKDDKYILIGIVAKGFGCGLEDFPGIYIAVRTYMKWIREIVFKGD